MPRFHDADVFPQCMYQHCPNGKNIATAQVITLDWYEDGVASRAHCSVDLCSWECVVAWATAYFGDTDRRPDRLHPRRAEVPA